MLRFIWFLILLLAGCALIFWPYQAEVSREAASLDLPAGPAARPLPVAWQNAAELKIRPLPGTAAAASGGEDACGAAYTVRRGDTLGEIARRCGVSLDSLLAANTRIRNPNRIEIGQSLAVPVAAAGGGIPETSRPAFAPGAEVEIEIGGLPPNQTVRIGLGLSSTGYRVLDQSVSGADGRLIARVTLPASARPGDSAFIMATTQGVPAAQAISETFTIAAP